jgi:cytochrome c oxidase subunit 4
MSSINPAHRLPDEPHGHSAAMPHHKVNYFAIFGLLVALTFFTVLVSMHRFESELVNVLLALIIASIKASMVAMYFMHLKFEGKLIYVILIVPLILCCILVMAIIPDIGMGLLHRFVQPPFVPMQ